MWTLRCQGLNAASQIDNCSPPPTANRPLHDGNRPLHSPIGAHFAMDNFFNISAVLFMWCMIPAFGAAAFVPSLVLGALIGRQGRGCAARYPCIKPAATRLHRCQSSPKRSRPNPKPPPVHAGAICNLAAERRLFVRERHDGLYRVATYLAAKMLDGADGSNAHAALHALRGLGPLRLRESQPGHP
jgi:hypothetical protein